MKVTCPICQRQFLSLMSHIRHTHKLTIETFSERYPDTPLISETTRRRVSKTCVVSCANNPGGPSWTEERRLKFSRENSGVNNVFYGKKHTVRTRRKMSQNHWDCTGDNNPIRQHIKDPEWLAEYKKAQKRVWQRIKRDPKRYRKICRRNLKTVTEAIIDGRLIPHVKGYKSGWYFSQKFNKRFHYRSSYELRFLELCEKDPKVKTLENCPFFIRYTQLGKSKRYIPDFLLNGDTVIEIKPSDPDLMKLNRLKILAGKRYCKKVGLLYKILTEKELGLDY